ncbi:5'/3'-nucleotidase SurE [Phenylobacterium sp. J367]|uniref:5'/3'-nucleotidase SurE n=1 Tax=Phenylobacterium sp. J367 TaxID=2898435 RepID=UPI0021511DC8|nr:5'/3'-nucleotidase SurE [Phenylobacterium sp. J367]MCR5879911.1 5'/3'-nucleotidase SurE [Phenylobacterium sp. J367]
MRILLTNDDGIHADGLAALERIAAELSDDVWVCAPEYEQSGASRALTLAEPIRVRQVGERKFSTTGTPTDCVMLGIHELVQGRRPDLVLSGVNRGANLAEDVTMSGTVAGAIEGMALGVPAIALSQQGFYEPGTSFEASETFAPGIIKKLVEIGWPNDVIMNVNFPAKPVAEITEVEVTRQGFRDVHVRHAEKRTDLRGKDYYWIGFRQTPSKPAEGTDLRALYEGRISVTPLHIDLSHMATVHDLKGRLGGPPPKA